MVGKRGAFSCVFLLVFSPVTMVFAASSSPKFWSEHVGSYLGYTIGYNTVDFTVGIPGYQDQSHHAVSQELLGGYMISHYYGVEFGIGSVVSSLGLCLRGALKGVYALTNRLSLSAQVGLSVINDALTDAIYGPYANAGINYAMSRNIDITVNESYMNADWHKFSWHTKNNALWSLEAGFIYHIS